MEQTAMTFCYPIRVYIEDTDAGGIVYHANHLKFCERARTEWLRAHGIAHYLLDGGFSFVVHHVDIRYHQPALMNDLLSVSVEPLSCKSASFVLRQRIHRAEILVADAKVSLACLDEQLYPRRLPPHIHTLIQQAVLA
jgi:acyl-CoA thioester hydrolase